MSYFIKQKKLKKNPRIDQENNQERIDQRITRLYQFAPYMAIETIDYWYYGIE